MLPDMKYSNAAENCEMASTENSKRVLYQQQSFLKRISWLWIQLGTEREGGLVTIIWLNFCNETDAIIGSSIE